MKISQAHFTTFANFFQDQSFDFLKICKKRQESENVFTKNAPNTQKPTEKFESRKRDVRGFFGAIGEYHQFFKEKIWYFLSIWYWKFAGLFVIMVLSDFSGIQRSL